MKLAITLLSLIAAFAAIVFLLLKPGRPKEKNAQNIRAALTRLLKRPYGAHLIIEEPSFGKFIQLSGSASEPLVFDLQRQNLTLDEYDNACRLFHELGYPEPETFDVYESVGKRPTDTQTSFIVPFGGDIEKATTLSLEVFEKVYGIDRSVMLKLTES